MKLKQLLAIFIITNLFALISQTALAVEKANNGQLVTYEIEFTDPNHHLLNVKAEFPAGEASLEISLPAWRTGNYKVLDLANGISDFVAFDVKGKSLSARKIDKSSWLVSNPSKRRVRVSYELYANEINSRTRSLTNDHFYLDASAVLVYSPVYRTNPVDVKLKMVEGWQSVSGMKTIADNHFKAMNYDVLVDSPIEGGLINVDKFSGEKNYRISGWRTERYDMDSIKKDVLKLEKEAQKLWQGFPFEDYLFILHAGPGMRGATEHINSTVMQFPFLHLNKREDYLRFIGTLAHEYVHTWNVKAYRAAGIAPYDYQQENYSHLLWLEEGATSYYDSLLTFRAGISNQQEFFKDLAKSINSYLVKPGVEHRSVAEASFDWWAHQGGQFDFNRSVSIYNEGMLTSLAIDFWMRDISEQQANFDDLHRLLYQRFRLPHHSLATKKGFSEQQLQQLVSELIGTSADKFWQQTVNSAERLDIKNILEKAGITLVRAKKSDYVNPGWTLKWQDNTALVNLVRENTDAWKSGITAGDKIIAIDKKEVSSELVDALFKYETKQDQVEIHYMRDGRLYSTWMEMHRNESPKMIVKSIKSPSKDQMQFFKRWTGHELQLNDQKSQDKDDDQVN